MGTGPILAVGDPKSQVQDIVEDILHKVNTNQPDFSCTAAQQVPKSLHKMFDMITTTLKQSSMLVEEEGEEDCCGVCSSTIGIH